MKLIINERTIREQEHRIAQAERFDLILFSVLMTLFCASVLVTILYSIK